MIFFLWVVCYFVGKHILNSVKKYYFCTIMQIKQK